MYSWENWYDYGKLEAKLEKERKVEAFPVFEEKPYVVGNENEVEFKSGLAKKLENEKEEMLLFEKRLLASLKGNEPIE